ncbi:hypothetical protein THAOC_03744 [Thalassiosira oceanica]|uniref:Uncharacterized protein n=1 Tax=Thalassiosira oceanica TaxID=159749 RepID=K0TKG6_THAOC|nr:hypothetical protein THAOC_03744 [Thalassiosira oceanica]|eukprot:EJK74566.1 hypothetical protein THAOC_03744 [Thalassiosira oceanica]
MRSVFQTITAAALLGHAWFEHVQLVSGFVSSRQSVTTSTSVTLRRFRPKMVNGNTDDSDSEQQNRDPIDKGDPDGVPIFDTNDRPATFLGLEPVAASDESDPPLQVTGPIVMVLSIYVTLSLFFGDGMPL